MMIRETIRFCSCLAVFSLVQTTAHSAFSDSFDELRAELIARSATLSSSPGTESAHQKKACDVSIVEIDQPAFALSSDIKTVRKIAVRLGKVFSLELLAKNSTTVSSINFSNDLRSIFISTYSNLITDVQAEIDSLVQAINEFPDGSIKVSAEGALSNAVFQINRLPSPVYALDSKLLVRSLRSALKGKKLVGSSPLQPISTMSATVMMPGEPVTDWIAGETHPKLIPNYILKLSGFAYGGNYPWIELNTCVGTFQNHPGDFPLTHSCGGYYGNISIEYRPLIKGLLHIATFKTHGTIAAATGTFAFEGTDPFNNIFVVTNGVFNLHNIEVSH
jgi:hypothetical protein